MNPIEMLKYKNKSIDDFIFENLTIPPMQCYLLPQDVESLRKIATSLRLSGKIQLKYKMIDDIMRARGFRRFARGTNRVVYSFLEDTRFVVKIALDRVGMQDNPKEYENQRFLQPFVAKMFYVSPCGTVGFAERVKPIANIEEFKEIADDVFYMLACKILGEYVVEDCGSKYFRNYGIRPGCGPVLLDYPYVYKLDGNKLICNQELEDGTKCGGEVGYDEGINYLYCNKCGKKYLASDLKDNSIINKLIIDKGGNKMKVCIVKGNKVLASNDCNVDEVIEKRRPRKKIHSKLIATISGGSSAKVENTDKHVNRNIRGFEVDPNSKLKASITSEAVSENKKRNMKPITDPDSNIKVSISNTDEEKNTKVESVEEVRIDTVEVKNNIEESVEDVQTDKDINKVEDTKSEPTSDEVKALKDAIDIESTEDVKVDEVKEVKKAARTARKKTETTSSKAKVDEVEEDKDDESGIHDYSDIVEKSIKSMPKKSTRTKKTIKKMIEDEELEDDMKKVKSKATKTKRVSSKVKSNYIPSKE